VDDAAGEVERPPWWKQSPGAWGCLQSHLAIYRWAIDEGLESVLILEDDAEWCDDFVVQATAFVAEVPTDWHQVYFGGQHWGDRFPSVVSPWVLRCRNVNRTHAYAARADFMRAAVDKLAERDNRHIDYQLGTMHESGKWNVYAPAAWLVGQDVTVSDIARTARGEALKRCAPAFWNDFQVEVCNESTGVCTVQRGGRLPCAVA
jgi:hypothetical protein